MNNKNSQNLLNDKKSRDTEEICQLNYRDLLILCDVVNIKILDFRESLDKFLDLEDDAFIQIYSDAISMYEDLFSKLIKMKKEVY